MMNHLWKATHETNWFIYSISFEKFHFSPSHTLETVVVDVIKIPEDYVGWADDKYHLILEVIIGEKWLLN